MHRLGPSARRPAVSIKLEKKTEDPKTSFVFDEVVPVEIIECISKS